MLDERFFRQLLQRGAVFLWHRYDRLDDPSVAAKPTFIVLLNAFLPDDADPLYYVLTTSKVEKALASPLRGDRLYIVKGTYVCFASDTVIDVSAAGDYHVGLDAFRALYDRSQVKLVGQLTEVHVRELDRLIVESRTVSRDMKRFITAW